MAITNIIVMIDYVALDTSSILFDIFIINNITTM